MRWTLTVGCSDAAHRAFDDVTYPQNSGLLGKRLPPYSRPDEKEIDEVVKWKLMNSAESLSRFGLVYFGYSVFAALVSIYVGWPAQFGGPGDPTQVFTEFFSRGTATAPPLLPLLFLGLGAVAVRRDGVLGVVGATLLTILGALFVIGGLGEIFAPDPITTPRAVLLAAGLVAIGGGAVLVTASSAVLVRRSRRRLQGAQ